MDEQDIRRRHFVDQMGILMVRSGGSVTMGRILGHMLICDPPEQSLSEIADGLGISKASASMLTRQLEQLGLLTRVPGKGRSTTYRMPIGNWTEVMREQIALAHLFVDLADQGLDLVKGGSDEGERLEDLRGFYQEMADEMTDFARRYEARNPQSARRKLG